MNRIKGLRDDDMREFLIQILTYGFEETIE